MDLGKAIRRHNEIKAELGKADENCAFISKYEDYESGLDDYRKIGQKMLHFISTLIYEGVHGEYVPVATSVKDVDLQIKLIPVRDLDQYEDIYYFVKKCRLNPEAIDELIRIVTAIDDNSAELINIQEDYDELQSDYDDLENQFDQVELERDDLKDENAGLTARISDLEDQVDDLERKIEEMEEE